MFSRTRRDSASSNSKPAKFRPSLSWSITRSTCGPTAAVGFFQDHPDAKAAMNRVAYEMGQRVTANLAADQSRAAATSWSAALLRSRERGGQIRGRRTCRRGEYDRRLCRRRAMPGERGGGRRLRRLFVVRRGVGATRSPPRGWSGFSLWGGSISFDTTMNWHFGLTTSGLASNELDFYSAATHEMGHILGIGTAPQWFNKVQGSHFVGPNAETVYGGAVRSTATMPHWADGLTIGGQAVASTRS